ncbi:MAG: helix-turn-helix transcriptional regulator [Rhodoglobus sp.]
MARRQTGVLLPLELDILSAGIDLQIANGSFYGFALAKTLSAPGHALTAHGTLYKALARMTASGLLEAEWEASEIGETAGRPRRRLYRVTGLGAEALASAVDDAKPAAAAGWAFS